MFAVTHRPKTFATPVFPISKSKASSPLLHTYFSFFFDMRREKVSIDRGMRQIEDILWRYTTADLEVLTRALRIVGVSNVRKKGIVRVIATKLVQRSIPLDEAISAGRKVLCCENGRRSALRVNPLRLPTTSIHPDPCEEGFVYQNGDIPVFDYDNSVIPGQPNISQWRKDNPNPITSSSSSSPSSDLRPRSFSQKSATISPAHLLSTPVTPAHQLSSCLSVPRHSSPQPSSSLMPPQHVSSSRCNSRTTKRPAIVVKGEPVVPNEIDSDFHLDHCSPPPPSSPPPPLLSSPSSSQPVQHPTRNRDMQSSHPALNSPKQQPPSTPSLPRVFQASPSFLLPSSPPSLPPVSPPSPRSAPSQSPHPVSPPSRQELPSTLSLPWSSQASPPSPRAAPLPLLLPVSPPSSRPASTQLLCQESPQSPQPSSPPSSPPSLPLLPFLPPSEAAAAQSGAAVPSQRLLSCEPSTQSLVGPSMLTKKWQSPLSNALFLFMVRLTPIMALSLPQVVRLRTCSSLTTVGVSPQRQLTLRLSKLSPLQYVRFRLSSTLPSVRLQLPFSSRWLLQPTCSSGVSYKRSSVFKSARLAVAHSVVPHGASSVRVSGSPMTRSSVTPLSRKMTQMAALLVNIQTVLRMCVSHTDMYELKRRFMGVCRGMRDIQGIIVGESEIHCVNESRERDMALTEGVAGNCSIPCGVGRVVQKRVRDETEDMVGRDTKVRRVEGVSMFDGDDEGYLGAFAI